MGAYSFLGVLLLAPLGGTGGGLRRVTAPATRAAGDRRPGAGGGEAQRDRMSSTQLWACQSSAAQHSCGPGDMAVTQTARVLPSVLHSPASLLQEGRRPIQRPQTDRQTQHCGTLTAPSSTSVRLGWPLSGDDGQMAPGGGRGAARGMETGGNSTSHAWTRAPRAVCGGRGGWLCQEISWKNLNPSVHPSGCQRVTSPHATQPPEYSTVLF